MKIPKVGMFFATLPVLKNPAIFKEHHHEVLSILYRVHHSPLFFIARIFAQNQTTPIAGNAHYCPGR
jgi:hypothetical protein